MKKLENNQVDLKGQVLSLENIRSLTAALDARGFASITVENEVEAVALLHHAVLDQTIRGALVPGANYSEFRQELAVLY